MVKHFDITQTIRDQVKIWCTPEAYGGRGFKDAKTINCGSCGEFAHFIWEASGKSDEIESLWGDEPEVIGLFNLAVYEPEGHVFIIFQDRFYDAECPEGVDKPTDLPFFKRQKRSKYRKMGLTVSS